LGTLTTRYIKKLSARLTFLANGLVSILMRMSACS
jgi:hypothetical protein